jgi:hypothetical protein
VQAFALWFSENLEDSTIICEKNLKIVKSIKL